MWQGAGHAEACGFQDGKRGKQDEQTRTRTAERLEGREGSEKEMR